MKYNNWVYHRVIFHQLGNPRWPVQVGASKSGKLVIEFNLLIPGIFRFWPIQKSSPWVKSGLWHCRLNELKPHFLAGQSLDCLFSISPNIGWLILVICVTLTLIQENICFQISIPVLNMRTVQFLALTKALPKLIIWMECIVIHQQELHGIFMTSTITGCSNPLVFVIQFYNPHDIPVIPCAKSPKSSTSQQIHANP